MLMDKMKNYIHKFYDQIVMTRIKPCMLFT